MTKELIFRGIIRAVFLFAYGAFLWASIHHLAIFIRLSDRRSGFTTEQLVESEKYHG